MKKSQNSTVLAFGKNQIVAGNVAVHSRSLIEDVDSNAVEQFNFVTAKLVGGKRINYSLRRGYQT